MTDKNSYSIGTKSVPWTQDHKAQWLTQQSVKRSYLAQVVTKIAALAEVFDVEQYATLDYSQHCGPYAVYPLFVIKSRDWQATKPTILVTGGVHGYETSGVHGAIAFMEQCGQQYSRSFNIIVAPCISPWGYETINRWNPLAIDPNRSFYQDSPAQESAALMQCIAQLGHDVVAHIDLHETTDTDNSEFRPALSARDGIDQHSWNIPDGFYLVGDTIKPQPAFQAAVIKAVEAVTHIAPCDEHNQLIGVDLAQHGVINYATRQLGLCAGLTDSQYCTTTEVYPDSPLVDDSNCVVAQVAAISGALDYLLSTKL